MFKLFDAGLCPIGIDVGTHAIRLLQLRSSSAGLSLQAACRIELECLDPGTLGARRVTEAVRQALTSQDFKGRRVALSLPVSTVQTKSVRLPQMPDLDLNQALQWEAKDRFGFEIGEAGGQLVWFRAGEVRRGTEVKDEILLFAVEGGILNDYMQGLMGLGLKISAIDLATCAAYRSIRRSASVTTGGGTTALLDLGHSGSQFSMTRGEELVFFKHIDMGGKAINEAVAAKLGISPAEALQMRSRLMPGVDEENAPLAQALRDAMRASLEELAREVDMCMRYYVVTFRGARPETIHLAGRQSSCAHTRDVLSAALSLQVEELQALRGVQELGDVARPDRSGEWAIATGLSLFPVAAKTMSEAA